MTGTRNKERIQKVKDDAETTTEKKKSTLQKTSLLQEEEFLSVLTGMINVRAMYLFLTKPSLYGL
jgi:hypothetical protein